MDFMNLVFFLQVYESRNMYLILSETKPKLGNILFLALLEFTQIFLESSVIPNGGKTNLFAIFEFRIYSSLKSINKVEVFSENITNFVASFLID